MKGFMELSYRTRLILPYFTAIVTIIVLIAIGFTLIYNTEKRIEQELKAQIIYKAGIYRARIEGALNTRLFIGQGFVSYVSVHPDLNRFEFISFAEKVWQHPDPVIRNISILKNTTIVYAFPIKGNEKAIGIDLATLPAQRDTVLQAIVTKDTVIAGPLELVQGGKGIISRMPIFVGKTYWGQVSVVLMLDALFAEAGISDEKDLRMAFRNKQLTPNDKPVFWGDPALFTDDALILDIMLPYGSWEMAVVPTYGWEQYPEYLLVYRYAGLFFAFLMGYFIWIFTRTQLALKEQAMHDYLTGLPNRAFFNDRLAMALHFAERHKNRLFLAMFDLNKFKHINDTFGHAMGDELLKSLAVRLSSTFRKTDTIARLGGDEFVLLLSELNAEFDKEELCHKLSRLIEEPFVCKGKMLYIGTSIGTAVYPDNGKTSDELLCYADEQMYISKQHRSV